MLSRMGDSNEELVSLLKDLQQKVNTVVEKTNSGNGSVEATNSVQMPAETPMEEPMAGGRRKRRRTKKQCGGRRKTKGRKGKGRSRRR